MNDRQEVEPRETAGQPTPTTPPEVPPTSLEEDRPRADEEIAEAARFPAQNPHPVFRVDPDAPVDRFPLPRALRGETVRSQLMQFRPAGEPEGATRYVLSSAVPIADGGGERLAVPKDVGTAIFRSVHEGLANVAQHAGATGVDLSMCRDGDALIVTLSDNGVGFETQSVLRTSALGLASIRERLETVGGRLEITSGSTGTTLRMRAPVCNGESEA